MRAVALAVTPEIVRHLLEDDDDFDTKELSGQGQDPDPNGYWTQVDGDFGDPWEYGGSWFNPVRSIVWHFEGLETMEQLGIGEIKPENVAVPAQVKAKLDQEYPLDYVDPDGDLEWQQETRDDNEREHDHLIDQYQVARAAYLNERKQYPWYEIDIPEDGALDTWMDEKVGDLVRSMGMEEEGFRALPLAIQYTSFIGYFGIDEIGSKFEMSRREATKELGVQI